MWVGLIRSEFPNRSHDPGGRLIAWRATGMGWCDDEGWKISLQAGVGGIDERVLRHNLDPVV